MAPSEELKGVATILAGQPAWVVVTVAALGVVGWIFKGGQLARIVESFHERDRHRKSIEFMQRQLLAQLAQRADLVEAITKSVESRSLPGQPEIAVEPTREEKAS